MIDNFDEISQMTYDQKRQYEENAKMVKQLTPLEALNILIGMAVAQQRAYEIKPIIETALKALEIIKIKRVDVELLMKTQNANEYNKFSKNVNNSHNLGQREYDFLKEVLL